MPYFRTWELNDVPSATGPKRVRINVGPLGYDYGDSNPTELCHIDRAIRTLLEIGETKKNNTNEKGLLVADAKQITLQDWFHWTGADGAASVVSESLGGDPVEGVPNSLLQRIFGGIGLRVVGTHSIGATVLSVKTCDTAALLKAGDLIRIGGQSYRVSFADYSVTDTGSVGVSIYPSLVTAVANNTLVFARGSIYEVYFQTLNDDGTLKEIYFAGDIEQDQITALQTLFMKPHTANEVARQNITLKIDATATRVASKTVKDLLDDPMNGLISNPPGDLHYGIFYSGLTALTDNYLNYIGDGRRLAPGKTEYAPMKYDPLGVAPSSLYFPGGLHGIRHTVIFDRIAKVAGLAGLKLTSGVPKFSSSFDHWLPAWNSTGSTISISSITGGNPWVVATGAAHGFSDGQYVQIAGTTYYNGRFKVSVVDPTHLNILGPAWGALLPSEATGTIQPFDFTLTTKVDPNDLGVAFQYLFGIDPMTGTRGKKWGITWTEDTSLADCLAKLANQHGAVARTEIDAGGLVWLVVEALRDEASVWVDESGTLTDETGVLPKKLVLSTSSVQARQISKAAVCLSNTADSGKYYSPIKATGETIDIEIPFRAHRYGFDKDALIYDPNKDVTEQWTGWKIETPGVSPNVSSPDGWLGGAYLYAWIDDSSAPIYPADYNTQWSIAGNNWHAIAYVCIRDQDPDTTKNYFNTVIAPAQFFEQELIHDSVVVNRSYAGATDDKGLLQTIRPRMTATWMHEQAIQKLRVDSVVQHEFSPGLDLVWIGYPATPEYLPLPPVVTDSESNSQTGGSSGTPSGGVSTPVTITESVIGQYRVKTRAVKFYKRSSGMTLICTLTTDVHEVYLADVGAWVADYADAPAAGDAANYDGWKFTFHRARFNLGGGTENGNVEVVDLDSAGVPGYRVSFEVSVTTGSSTAAFYHRVQGYWNGRLGQWVTRNPLEGLAPDPHVQFHGRIVIQRNDASSNANFNAIAGGKIKVRWANLTDATFPASDLNTLMVNGSELGVPRSIPTNYNQWDLTLTPPKNQTGDQYFLPQLNLHATGNGSLRITIAFGVFRSGVYIPKFYADILTARPFYYPQTDPWHNDFGTWPVKCQWNNGANSNPSYADIDITKTDYDKIVAVVPGPPFNNLYNRDVAADPSVQDDLGQLIIDVFGLLSRIGEPSIET